MRKRENDCPPFLIEMDRKDWRFEGQELPEAVQDMFFDVLDSAFSDFGGMYLDDPAAIVLAEKKLRALVVKYPYFIDGYHHLALLLDETGRAEEARLLWEKAALLGLQGVVEQFCGDGNNLRWGYLDNRPFLRVYHSLGLRYMNDRNFLRALGVFRTIIKANPNDNQGVRGLLVQCYLEVDEPTEVLKVCMLYPNDTMEELVYGKVLALLMIGKKPKAEQAFREAMKCLPNIAQELGKKTHRQPKGFGQRFLTVGSEDEAFVYWQRQGHLWKKTPGAIDFVREFLKNGATR